MKYFAWFLGACFLVMSACVIDDEDRCPSGFYWDNDLKSCLQEEEEEDAGGCVIEEGNGLGEECMEDADCADYVADFCQTNPLTPDAPGFCTVTNCSPADCACEYSCCDCTGVDVVPFDANCIGEAGVGQLESLGCTCG